MLFNHIATHPPDLLALQESKLSSESVSVYSPEILAYITPPYPFVHVQFVNDIPERLSEWTSDFSSNIVPFPELRVMLTKEVSEKETFDFEVLVLDIEKRDAFWRVMLDT